MDKELCVKCKEWLAPWEEVICQLCQDEEWDEWDQADREWDRSKYAQG